MKGGLSAYRRLGAARWRIVVSVGLLLALTGGGGLASAARGGERHAHRGARSSATGGQNPNATRVIYEQARGVVHTGMTDGFVERCPAAVPHAISGYFGSNDKAAYGQLTLAASAPVGHSERRWAVAVKDLGSEAYAYFAGVVCASAQQPFSYGSNTATLDPGQTAGYTELCPKVAPQPIGGMFYPLKGAAGELELAQSNEIGAGWATVVKNVSGQPQAYVLGAVCARRGTTVSYLTSDLLSVLPSHANGAHGRCPKRTPHAVGGSFYAPRGEPLGQITLADSYPYGARTRPFWTTDVVNVAGQPQNVVVGTVCMA